MQIIWLAFCHDFYIYHLPNTFSPYEYTVLISRINIRVCVCVFIKSTQHGMAIHSAHFTRDETEFTSLCSVGTETVSVFMLKYEHCLQSM